MASSKVDYQPNRSPNLQNPSINGKTRVIGLYGISGSGKTFLLHQLKQKLGEEHFSFYEGSEMVASVIPGGLEAFQKLDEQDKVHWRQRAIDAIGKQCTNSGQVAVVTGHFMFWPENEEMGWPVYTQNDLETYTHILYLDVPVEVVLQRRLNDTERSRPPASAAHLRKWQQEEKAQLRRLCRDHSILFSLVSPHPTKVSTLLRDFRRHTEEYNLHRAERELDDAFAARKGQLETVLVMDADRTLAAEDTGTLFWKQVQNSRRPVDETCTLRTLFTSRLAYSYTAFRQATLLYEEATDDQEYDALCQDVASVVTLYPEFVSLLQKVAQQEHIGAVVVSCGLRRVWEKVLERKGLSQIRVIAGGRITDDFVVTAAVKAALVSRLQDIHQVYVWAFGDSVLDLDMLKKADRAIVVVGDEHIRSKTMDAALLNAINLDGLQALQVPLPSNALPRLDTTKLPVVDLTESEFIGSVLCRRYRLQVFLATDRNAAKLLATPMRDAIVAGPALRKAHRRVGWYLGCEFLTGVIGVEECQISHVLGHHTTGYRLLHEQRTTIVALMRAGEPMASGVNDAFPLAMYVHANRPGDIKLHHIQQQLQVLLVDSVVNSGKTVVEFVQAIRSLDANIRIVVVAGVVQSQCVCRSSLISTTFAHDGNISLVALRLSDTKFTGSGTTDTGNRLFNTTHLP